MRYVIRENQPYFEVERTILRRSPREGLLRGMYGFFFTFTREDEEITESLQENILQERGAMFEKQDDLEDGLEEDNLENDVEDELEDHFEDDPAGSKELDVRFAKPFPASQDVDMKELDGPSRSLSPAQQSSWIPNPIATTVDVSRGLIREYFQKRGVLEASNIGVGFHKSHYTIAKICLEILTLYRHEISTILFILTEIFSTPRLIRRWIRRLNPWPSLVIGLIDTSRRGLARNT